MTFDENLKLHLRAGVPALYVESHEWLRFRTVVERCCEDLGKSLFVWNALQGLAQIDLDKKQPKSWDDDLRRPERLLEDLRDSVKENAVYVLEFFNFAEEAEAERANLAPHFAAAVRPLRNQKSHVIVLSPALKIPEAVRSEFAVLEFPLPDHGDIRKLLEQVKTDFRLEAAHDDTRILDSVRGLGTTEIWNAFAKAAAHCKKITSDEIPMLVDEKEQIIRKSGYLEFVRTDIGMKNVGGLDELKGWLNGRKSAFGEDARRAGLDAPKGILLVGVPGTGKSLCAKAVASQWEMPLLRLDMGRVFGGLVGESESNIRGAVKVAEGLAPCVLWIDEIEKGFSGGSGELDGGTSTRVFGSFLTWMQEKDKEVFVFATANDLRRMPPELLRKGRFDEIFFVDLPGEAARREIFRIHLKRKNQRSDMLTDTLISAAEGFSGSEIEGVVSEALVKAYNERDGDKPPVVKAADMLDIAKKLVPLSETMRETIEGLRKSKARFRPTSSDAPPEIPKKGGDAPPLVSEGASPFRKSRNRPTGNDKSPKPSDKSGDAPPSGKRREK